MKLHIITFLPIFSKFDGNSRFKYGVPYQVNGNAGYA
jgi:hypothetical protein